jgi:hypothetical protein
LQRRALAYACLSTRAFSAFLWALVFFLYLWFGMLAVGVSGPTSFVLALVVAR